MTRMLSDDVAPSDLRPALENLAAAIFRLDDWIRPAKFVPPDSDQSDATYNRMLSPRFRSQILLRPRVIRTGSRRQIPWASG